MAELTTPLYPPKTKASPWISTIEGPRSFFGNGGPNVIKEEKGTVNEMSFFSWMNSTGGHRLARFQSAWSPI